ncbi:MAG: hypothetical protein PHR56_00020 [Dehalococcoidales bacterium]|nr:hypothetical protein [Dehalococcoidales bacterium]
MKVYRFLLVTIVAVAAMLQLAWQAPASAAVGVIELDIRSGPVGTVVAVTGTGFTPGVTYTVQFATAAVESGTTDAAGDINTYFTVPAYPRGQQSITVTTSAGDTSNNVVFSVQPAITTSLTSGRIGDSFIVTGTGFKAASSITIYFDAISVGTVYASAAGTFASSVVVVPAGVTKGAHSITARDIIGASSPVTFNVQEPQIVLSATSGRVGDKFNITGSGFRPSSGVTIYFDSLSLGSSVTDATGAFASSTVSVPPAANGSHAITARDAVAVTPAASFNVLQNFTANPASGVVDDRISVSGSGFARSSSMIFTLDAFVISGVAITTDANGSFTGNIDIPPCSSGSHQLQAKDAQGNSAAAAITVGQKVAITPTAVATGEQLTVSGSGFASNSNLTLSIDGKNLSSGVTVAANGSFTDSLSIPQFPGGRHELQVKDALGNTATAAFTVGQKMSIEPVSGVGGAMVSISGSGFAAGKAISIKCNGTNAITNPATIVADSTGSFSGSFQSPPGVIGNYTVKVDDGTNSASASFTASFQAEISPVTSVASPGRVGMPLTVTGSGFRAKAEITIKNSSAADSTILAITSSDSAGCFFAAFNAPSAKSGTHTIIATDGTNTKQLSFVMEANAPQTPVPVLPELLAKSAQPVSFDWSKADDPSGITYTLQIAGDREFRNVMVEKKGLTTPGYTMLKKDKLRPVPKENPYFWRVKAIDGTGSESAWSETMAFYVGFVVSLTDDGVISFDGLATLPLNLLYAAVGVVLFLVALFSFMLGRRSARRD